MSTSSLTLLSLVSLSLLCCVSYTEGARMCGVALVRYVRSQCLAAKCEEGQRAAFPAPDQLKSFAMECCAHSCPYDKIRSMCCEAVEEDETKMVEDYEQVSKKLPAPAVGRHHHKKHHSHHHRKFDE